MNFGTTKADYLNFTEVEKALIRKEHENKIVQENTHIRNAVMNAYTNARRSKNKKFNDLYTKQRQEKADIEYNQNALSVIHEVEARDGKSWVDKIYKEAGTRKPSKPIR